MLNPQDRRRFRIGPLLAMCALAFVIFFNFAFFSNTARSYPPLQDNIGFLLSLAVLLGTLSTLLLALVCNRYTVKPLLILLFPAAATAAYFMDSYNVVIDSQMIGNAVQTNFAEASDLFSARLLLYIAFLGLLPAAVVYRLPLATVPLWQGLRSTAKVILLSVAAMALAVTPFSAQYASFSASTRCCAITPTRSAHCTPWAPISANATPWIRMRPEQSWAGMPPSPLMIRSANW